MTVTESSCTGSCSQGRACDCVSDIEWPPEERELDDLGAARGIAIWALVGLGAIATFGAALMLSRHFLN